MLETKNSLAIFWIKRRAWLWLMFWERDALRVGKLVENGPDYKAVKKFDDWQAFYEKATDGTAREPVDLYFTRHEAHLYANRINALAKLMEQIAEDVAKTRGGHLKKNA